MRKTTIDIIATVICASCKVMVDDLTGRNYVELDFDDNLNVEIEAASDTEVVVSINSDFTRLIQSTIQDADLEQNLRNMEISFDPSRVPSDELLGLVIGSVPQEKREWAATEERLALLERTREALRSYRAEPAGSWDKSLSALQLLKSAHWASSTIGSPDADVIGADLFGPAMLVELRANAGDPLRYQGEDVFRYLLDTGEIVMCLAPRLGTLDVPGGRYAVEYAINDKVDVLLAAEAR